MICAVYYADGDHKTRAAGEEAARKHIEGTENPEEKAASRIVFQNPRYFRKSEMILAQYVVVQAAYPEVIEAYEEAGADVFVLGQYMPKMETFQKVKVLAPEPDEDPNGVLDYVDANLVNRILGGTVSNVKIALGGVDSVIFCQALREAEEAGKNRGTAISAIVDRIRHLEAGTGDVAKDD